MSTHSITGFIDKDGEEIVTMYRHMDGYPAGHGVDLANLMLSIRDNGFGCFVAQVIGALKDGSMGNIYLEKPNTRGMGEEYLYKIREVKNPEEQQDRFLIEVFKPRDTLFSGLLFSGNITEYVEWIEHEKEKKEERLALLFPSKLRS